MREDQILDEVVARLGESETIQEFYGRFAAAEKDGDIKRPSNISQERFQEEAEEYFNEYWSKFC